MSTGDEVVVDGPAHWALFGSTSNNATANWIPLRTDQITTVGRLASSDIQLSSGLVSGRHAALISVGDLLIVRDLNSTNGTYRNGVPVRKDTYVGQGDLLAFADAEFEVQATRVQEVFDTATQVMKSLTDFDLAIETGWAFSQMQQLQEPDGLTPYAQPIVHLENTRPFGYEFLARGAGHLESAAAIFRAAKQLKCEARISNLCRERAIRMACGAGIPGRLFINTHPAESLLVEVVASLRSLREEFPETSIVVELSEGAIIDDLETIRRFREELDSIGVEIAYDDFGAGRARLRELLRVPPQYIKFDSSFISEIDRLSKSEYAALGKIVSMIRDLGVSTIAEGIETRSQYDAVVDVGMNMGQGYLFGRPQPITATVAEDTDSMKQNNSQAG